MCVKTITTQSRRRESKKKILKPLDTGLRDCVAINLYYFIEKRGLLELPTMDFFKKLGVKPFLKTSMFSLFSNCDTVSKAGIQY